MRTIPLPRKPGDEPYRVAIYCRVGSKEQVAPAQKEHQLRKLIENTPNCSYAGAYCDCGVPGPMMKRPALSKLTLDCQCGNVDIVVMQSISRLGRNIVDCLSYLKLLESYGTLAYFANEAISTAK